MESRETELCNKLYKTRKRTTNIFGFSNFEARTEGNNKQSKIFLDFSNTKAKIRNKANQSSQSKKANKEKQRKYFWSFCVLESRNKNKKNKEKKRKQNMDIQSTDKI
jgi:hypothetical protein